MTDLLELARRNQRRAREVIRMCGVVAAWESVGAEIHPVGSLPTGLLMTHRDIDFHIYTPRIDPADDFRAMGRLAACPAVRRVAYANLLDTPETCLEWHAWVEDADRELWQLDMIHIALGSRYDGYFERVAGRIAEVLTDDTRLTILRPVSYTHLDVYKRQTHSSQRRFSSRPRRLSHQTSASSRMKKTPAPTITRNE